MNELLKLLAALLNIDTTRRGWQRITIITARLEIEKLKRQTETPKL